MIRWLTAALAALFLITAPAAAQTLQQSGTVSPGHLGAFVTSGLVKDAGSPSNFQANGLGLYNGTNSPLGISSQTGAGALSGTWGTLTLGSTSSAASLTTLNSAGTAQPLNLAIGGDTTYVIGGTNWLSTIFNQQICSTVGSVLYRDSGGTWKCLGPGSSGQVLQTQGAGANPQWAGSGGIGTVTSITAGTGLSGGTITTSGTIALLNPVAVNLGGTGAATLAAHGVLIGNGTSAVNVATPGASGTVLQSNGAGADPTWNAVAGTGTVTSITAANSGVVVSPSPLVTSGTIALGPATASILGGVKPDGTTITNTAGAIAASAWVGSGFINKLRNATMVSWPNGTSGTIATAPSGSSFIAANGWAVAATGATGTWSRQVLGDNGTLYSLRLTGNTSNTDVTAAQRISGSDGAAIAGQTATFQAAIFNNSGASLTPSLSTCFASVLDNFGTCTADLAGTNLQSCSNASWCIESYTFAVSASASNGYQVKLDFGALNANTKYVQITAPDLRATPSVAIGLNAAPPTPELPGMGAELERNAFYFSSSYGNGVAPGTVTTAGAGYALSLTSAVAATVQLNLRTAGAISLYSPNSGASGNIYNKTANADEAASVQVNGEKGFGFLSSATWSSQQEALYHWTDYSDFW